MCDEVGYNSGPGPEQIQFVTTQQDPSSEASDCCVGIEVGQCKVTTLTAAVYIINYLDEHPEFVVSCGPVPATVTDKQMFQVFRAFVRSTQGFKGVYEPVENIAVLKTRAFTAP